VIDDFGGSACVTDELALSRWIVPWGETLRFLNLANGKKVQVPFDQLIIFSQTSNQDLVDEAFLRRIPTRSKWSIQRGWSSGNCSASCARSWRFEFDEERSTTDQNALQGRGAAFRNCSRATILMQVPESLPLPGRPPRLCPEYSTSPWTRISRVL